MKILHTVESYYPLQTGMAVVVRQLSEHLVRSGHMVTVATSKIIKRRERVYHDVQIQEFKISGKMANRIVGEKEAYQSFLLNTDFDLMTNFAAQQWATDLMLPLLPKIKAKKVFVPTGFSGLHDPVYKDYFAKMPDWMGQYDMNVFHSHIYRDIQFAKEHGVKNLIVIPNGASEEEFLAEPSVDIRKKLGIPFSHFFILHVGNFNGQKGQKQAIKIFKQAYLQRAALVLVGKVLSFRAYRKHWLPLLVEVFAYNHHLERKHDGNNIIITTLSREETITAFQEADLFLFPSQIECSPLVLFESMAARTPFLTTDVGNAKEIVSWSEAGMILPTRIVSIGLSLAEIESSAKLLRELYENRAQRSKLADNGYQAWKKDFTWRKIAQRYESLYLSLLNQQ